MVSDTDRIKEALPIETVIGAYIELKQAGMNYKACCPFHNEKTPSFQVSPERGSFYCFGCQKGGDIFSFVQEFENVDFKEALVILAQKAGIELSNQYEKKEDDSYLYDIHNEAVLFYQQNLRKNESAQAYLKKRGVSSLSTVHFKLGFATEAWEDLYKHLKNKKFSDDQINETGLILAGKRGFYDRFRNRLMFPVTDTSGRVVAFSGRAMGDDKAKYINSPETKLYKKKETLYGLFWAKGAIKKYSFVLLVEGQFDLIMCHQSGYSNAIAASGTAFSAGDNKQVSFLKRLTPNVLVMFDSDSAGKSATQKMVLEALPLGFNIKMSELPLGSDPADIILESPDEFKKIVREAKDYVLAVAAQAGSLQAQVKISFVQEKLIPLLRVLPSKIARAEYIKQTALLSGVNVILLEEAVGDQLENDTQTKSTPQKPATPPAIVDTSKLEKAAKLVLASMTLLSSRSVKEYERIKGDLETVVNEFNYALPNVQESDMFSLEKKYNSDNNLMLENTQVLLRIFEKELLVHELAVTKKKLTQAEMSGESTVADSIMKQFVTLQSRIKRITF